MADITLTYKGATIAELNDSGSKTLRTADKFCEADIVVKYVKSGGSPESGVFFLRTEEEMTLKELLNAHPIPLKYRDEILWVRFYNDEPPSAGATSNWHFFAVQNLLPVWMLINYTNSTTAASSLPFFSTTSGSHNSYFAVSNYAVTASNLTNATRKIAAGTDVYILHIPFNWATFSMDTETI